MASELSRPGAVERTLVRVGNALRGADVPFALTGGSAVYARGGPFSEHDVDVLVRCDDAERAVRTLVGIGMRAADAPEDWLHKVYDGDVLVDLIHRPADLPVTDEMLAAADELQVGPMTAPVAPATDVLVQKLLVLGPHHCDYTWVLPAARALREQVDWDVLIERTGHSPYAEAFLLLADRLQIAPGIHNGRADEQEGRREPAGSADHPPRTGPAGPGRGDSDRRGR